MPPSFLTIIFLLQLIVFLILFKKQIKRTRPKTVIVKVVPILYTGLNIILILSYWFRYSMITWLNRHSLDFLLDGVVFLVILSTIPTLYLLIRHFLIKLKKQTESHNNARRKFINTAALSLGLGSIAFSGVSTYSYQEKENLQITKLNLPIKNLPPAFHDFKIVHLSDIHASFFIREKYLTNVVNKVNSLNSDLIALTGDFVTHNTVYFQEFRNAFSKLDQHCHKLAVLGNHDYWIDHHYIAEGLRATNIQVLNNENRSITRNGNSIHIAGVEDIYTKRDDINKAAQNLPANDVSILLCHNPDLIDKAGHYHFDLMLSGHTHGGQIQLPFYGPIIVPSKYGTQYAQGLHQVNNTYLYVNRGIGVVALPIRIHCRPEITLITLKREV